jgi:hypothetical protein
MLRGLKRAAHQSRILARRIRRVGSNGPMCMCMSAMSESERQTAHVALLIKPSMKRMVERRARTEGVTANEFIRRAIE